MENTPDRRLNLSAVKRAQEVGHTRPWQLLMLSTRSDQISLSERTVSALTRILDLLPNLPGLTIKTSSGDVHVSRDFSGDTASTVDSLISSILKDDPNIAGIVFPGSGKRPEHTATIYDPHYLPEGKQRAIVREALKAGLIDSAQALRKTKAIYTKE